MAAMDLELPPELTCTPLALVAFVGLDHTDKQDKKDGDTSGHADLWKRFVVDRGLDRVPVRIRHTKDLRWPQMKPKRNTYEWFIPKGILKRNW